MVCFFFFFCCAALLKCNYSFSCCLTKGWMRNILHSQHRFLSRLSVSQQPHVMDGFSRTLLYIWCCQLPHLYERSGSVMHDCVNIRAQLYALKHGLPRNHVCCSAGCTSVHCCQTLRVILGREVYFCLIIFSCFLLVGKPNINIVHQM